MGQLNQGVAVNPQALRSRLLNNAEHLRAMGATAQQRVHRLYARPAVIGQSRDLIKALQTQRHQALADGETTTAELPPWLPSCRRGFGVFASQVILTHSTPPSSDERTNLMRAAGERLNRPLDARDADLQEELLRWGEDASQIAGLSPRARDWLDKQGRGTV